MAETLTKRPVQPVFLNNLQPDQVVQTVPFLSKCKGINQRITTEQMSPDDASELENFFFNEAGKLQVRGGTLELGTKDGSENVTHLAVYQRGDGRKYVVRWLKTKVHYYYNGTWNAFTGSPPSLSATQRVSHASWGPNTLLYVANSQVYALDFSTFAVSNVAASPANSQFVYVLGNRAIVCAPGTNYTRVQWSIKLDYTDWSSAGSGFEDIIPGPTGAGDTVLGGFPINDTEALVVRANSVWMQTITGSVDAPFAFRYLYPVSLHDVWSAAVAPGGVFCLGNNDVYFLTASAPESIGDPIKNRYIEDITNVYGNGTVFSDGSWDEYRQAYYLSVPKNSLDNAGELLVFHKKLNAWTTFKYLVSINCVCVLNGPLDAITPTSYYTRGPIISQHGDGSARTLYEEPNTYTDVTSAGATSNMTATAIMAALKPQDWNRKVKFESLTLDVNGGTQSAFYASVYLFAPSRFNDTIFETITLDTNFLVQSAKLRQRQTFFAPRERNGIVPKLSLIGAPMIALNSVDLVWCDGSIFIQSSTATKDRITVDLTTRIVVGGTMRVVV